MHPFSCLALLGCILFLYLRGKKVQLQVYNPPESSKYSSIEMFDEIENQVVKYYEEEMAVCIIGVINARSRGLNAVLYFDKNVIDLHVEEDFIKRQIGSEALLEELRIPLIRMSCDKQTNN